MAHHSESDDEDYSYDDESEFDEEEEEPRSSRKKRGRSNPDSVAGGARGKRRKPSGSIFIEDDVIVDDEEDDDDDVEDGFIEHGEADLGAEDVVGRRHRHFHEPAAFHSRVGAEEYLDFMQEKYSNPRAEYDDDDDYEDEEAVTEVDQQSLLPSVRDPKLWMVKCAIGREREVAVCLMQKAVDRGSDFKIRSVIALDHLQNFIYIEADMEAHVKEAIKGMRNVFANHKILLVPIREMADVLSVRSKTVELARDTWVRMKLGIYKGDLAQVVDVDDVRRRVTVKLIPRIDLQLLADKQEGSVIVKKKAFVPPPRFMNVDEARELHIRVERRRDRMTGDYFENIGNMLFKDGFLYKKVSTKSISTLNVTPTFDELERFKKANENGEIDFVDMSTLFANRKKGHFMKGDEVIVIKGDLKNLKGWVEKVDEENVLIRSEMKGLHNPLAVNERELCKYFEPGNHVKVVSGTHKEATGMVVKVDQHVLFLLTDTTKQQIRVFADHVVKSAEVTNGVTKMGEYELHDLVLLSNLSFGVIIKLDTEAIQVLKGVPGRPELAIVKHGEIKYKIEKKITVKDRYKNVMTVKDVVRVTEGPSKGKQGPVMHIYKGVLFLHDRHNVEHAGFVCVKCSSCVLSGGSYSGADRIVDSFSRLGNSKPPASVPPSPRRFQRADLGYNSGPGGRHWSGRGGRGNDLLVGAYVRVRLGPYKGYRGRIVEVKEKTVRLEHEAKIVTVNRDAIADGNDNVATPSQYNMGSQTPVHPSRTPLHPCMTPMRDSGATPIHNGMRTPMRDRAWNPYTPMSPPRDSWEDGNPGSWGTNSLYPPDSPYSRPYEAATPGSGWDSSTPGRSYSDAGTPRDANVPSPYQPMTREPISTTILINSSICTVQRIAVLDGEKLVELLLEPVKTNVQCDSVYLGVVTKFVPHMGGAFVNIGSSRHSFMDIKPNREPFIFPPFCDGSKKQPTDGSRFDSITNIPAPHETEHASYDFEASSLLDIDSNDPGESFHDDDDDHENDEDHVSDALINGTVVNHGGVEGASDKCNQGDELHLDVGSENGFVPLEREHSDSLVSNASVAKSPKNVSSRDNKWIQVRKGTKIIVQVVKEGLGTKGPTLTAYPKLRSRFWVLMTRCKRIGVSKKISGIERTRLKVIAKTLQPQGFGLTVRTVAAGHSLEELQKDLEGLLLTWKTITEEAKSASLAADEGVEGAIPALLHRAMGQTLSVVQDYFNDKVEKMVVDSPRTYHEVTNYLQDMAPDLCDRVELHDKGIPLFDLYNIEEEIEGILSKRVPLPNGGSLVIEQTEALVSIDVNGGHGMFGQGNSQEKAILEVNLTAARQIAREIRLRDIGGIIVVDFIDMADESNKRLVYEEVKKAVEKDRSLVKVSELSRHGLMEITRKRVRPSVTFMISEPCSCCHATGRVEALETSFSKIEQEICRQLAKMEKRGDLENPKSWPRFILRVDSHMSSFLTTGKRTRLAILSSALKVWILLKVARHFTRGTFEVKPFMDEKTVNERPHQVAISLLKKADAIADSSGKKKLTLIPMKKDKTGSKHRR